MTKTLGSCDPRAGGGSEGLSTPHMQHGATRCPTFLATGNYPLADSKQEGSDDV